MERGTYRRTGATLWGLGRRTADLTTRQPERPELGQQAQDYQNCPRKAPHHHAGPGFRGIINLTCNCPYWRT
eukprot:11867818-Prorocentrum_lima.AAC.1